MAIIFRWAQMEKKKFQRNTNIGNKLFTDEKIVFNSIYLSFLSRENEVSFHLKHKRT